MTPLHIRLLLHIYAIAERGTKFVQMLLDTPLPIPPAKRWLDPRTGD